MGNYAGCGTKEGCCKDSNNFGNAEEFGKRRQMKKKKNIRQSGQKRRGSSEMYLDHERSGFPQHSAQTSAMQSERSSTRSSVHSQYELNQYAEGICFYDYIVQTCGQHAPALFSDKIDLRSI